MDYQFNLFKRKIKNKVMISCKSTFRYTEQPKYMPDVIKQKTTTSVSQQLMSLLSTSTDVVGAYLKQFMSSFVVRSSLNILSSSAVLCYDTIIASLMPVEMLETKWMNIVNAAVIIIRNTMSPIPG